ncbi:hypothetical protein L1987_10741 [Smallanthus sonchifolius]|uniref:Uncharacterized protein n=1 Tax=Smallanthus sonchifolius TaxID=185202 RepID=A0ACB9JB35_9ASTR|nr:hypothetical protein L1987_10741 [Smallanthus sonchifolius]
MAVFVSSSDSARALRSRNKEIKLPVGEEIMVKPRESKPSTTVTTLEKFYSDLGHQFVLHKSDESEKMAQIMMDIHDRQGVHACLMMIGGDSWISQNHVWVLLKCVKLDPVQLFLPLYPWRSEWELQGLWSAV